MDFLCLNLLNNNQSAQNCLKILCDTKMFMFSVIKKIVNSTKYSHFNLRTHMTWRKKIYRSIKLILVAGFDHSTIAFEICASEHIYF